MLTLEMLEDRVVPASLVVLSNGTLFVDVQGGGTHTVSVDSVAQGTQVQVTLDGTATLFDATQVQRLVVDGAEKAPNVIQNNSGLTATLIGGDKADRIFGGAGSNYIDPGKGRDLVYALLGQNTILAVSEGKDRVFTNFGAQVNADDQDLVVRFFAPGRTPGTPFIGQEADGVLYITPSNNGSTVVLNPGDKPGDVVVTYDLGDGNGLQTATFSGVVAISYFGGTGSDVYVNNTDVVEAAYGSGGNDRLVGGTGKFTLLKGSGGDDTLVGRAQTNDLSGNGGADVLFAMTGQGKNVFRTDALDTLVGATDRDVYITP